MVLNRFFRSDAQAQGAALPALAPVADLGGLPMAQEGSASDSRGWLPVCLPARSDGDRRS